MNDQKNNNSFIIGVLVGAALTYLFTTKKGQKIKEELLREGTKLLKTLSEELKEGSEKTQELIEEGKDKVEGKIIQGEKVVAKEAENLPKQVAEIQKKGRRFFFHKRPSES